ncbi:pyridoxamine 5'-phosphate oxidase family protein [Steroidobacter sp.]|uniref:pyridoxamine 5'-phosphate oxidase family protein n=1 Tax=Steroidobacter sp. TaxID=1978227 RepID=UPI001A615F5E|nr:pyridoxamine 5'-phosphate oxidase family protein [Steroidobacter sp.]MBL8269330.1 pyridoxamine 5'-phosphate oxidase family protein [Steroidobacter sp.]
MSSLVSDLDTLQGLVGKLPGPRDLKVIDFLDEHALRWIAASPVVFVTFGTPTELAVTVAASGETGFTRIDESRHFSLPLTSLDDPQLAREGVAVATLFLVPGMEETLRINGRVTSVADGQVGIAVHECYLHCAKAFMRSSFWSATPSEDVSTDHAEFVSHSRFMALATIDDEGHADLSPKGDPTGSLLQAHQNAIWYPDRPGNRRIDSFRNILTQPRIAALVVIPGSLQVMHISGQARVSTDETVRTSFAVSDKTPKVVTRIENAELSVRKSEALARARLWPTVPTTADLNPADIFKAHVQLSRETGLQATLVRAAVAVPGMMRKGLENDYKNNLY